MKVSDLFVRNTKEIVALSKVKMKLTKSLEEKILSMPEYNNRGYYSLVQLWRGKIIERIFAVRTFRGKKEYQEVIRRIEGNTLCLVKNMYFSYCGGYITVWHNSRPSPYCFDKNKAFNVWFQEPRQYYQVMKIPLYKLEDVKQLDPSLKYCAWSNKVNLIEWISIYRIYPEIEILGRLNLQGLYSSYQVLKKLKDTKFKKWLCSLTEQERINDVKVLLYAYNHKMSVADSIFRKDSVKHLKKIQETYPDIDMNQLTKYYKAYFLRTGNIINAWSYIDMIEAEKLLRQDLTLEKNMFPHDFDYWHDHYVNQLKLIEDQKIEEGIKIQKEKYKKYGVLINGIQFMLPTSSMDLVNEGEQLHHCVGKMGYNKKIAKEESLIVFLRKEEDLEKSFATMEYDLKTKTILQLFGDRNQKPTQEIQDIVYNKWLPKVNRLKIA